MITLYYIPEFLDWRIDRKSTLNNLVTRLKSTLGYKSDYVDPIPGEAISRVSLQIGHGNWISRALEQELHCRGWRERKKAGFPVPGCLREQPLPGFALRAYLFSDGLAFELVEVLDSLSVQPAADAVVDGAAALHAALGQRLHGTGTPRGARTTTDVRPPTTTSAFYRPLTDTHLEEALSVALVKVRANTCDLGQNTLWYFITPQIVHLTPFGALLSALTELAAPLWVVNL